MGRDIALVAVILLSSCRVDVELGLAEGDTGAMAVDASPTFPDADEPSDAGIPKADAGTAPDATAPDSRIEWDAQSMDSATDAGPTPIGIVTPGAYALGFMEGPQVMCFDALTGHETDYNQLKPENFRFMPGHVEVGTLGTLTIGGAPIMASYGAQILSLQESDGMPPGPPTSWYFIQVNSRGSGPNGTFEAARLLAVDTAPDGMLPNGFLGQAGVAFSNTSSTGTCIVEFIASFTRP